MTRQKEIRERIEAATPEALITRASGYAEAWIAEELKRPDDIPSVLEVAFTDGYLTGNLHSRATDDIAYLLTQLEKKDAMLKVVMDALDWYSERSNYVARINGFDVDHKEDVFSVAHKDTQQVATEALEELRRMEQSE